MGVYGNNENLKENSGKYRGKQGNLFPSFPLNQEWNVCGLPRKFNIHADI